MQGIDIYAHTQISGIKEEGLQKRCCTGLKKVNFEDLL